MELVEAISNGLQMGFIYALVAVGLTIIWGLMETINFAHGEVLMLGMFGAWWLSDRFGLDPLVTMAPIAVVMFGLGVVIYRLLMSRVQRGEVFTQIFATFGLLLLLQNSAVAVFTSDPRILSTTWLNSWHGGGFLVGNFVFSLPQLVGGLLALVIFGALYVVIDRTEIGLALQATAEDREAAALVGVEPRRMFALGWGLGAALVAIAGVLLANFFAIYPQVGLPFTLLAYATVALGGFGSILGTLVAALLVGVVESISAYYFPPAFKDALVFAAYLFIGLFRPQGLFGRF